jgi:hypothetical protein
MVTVIKSDNNNTQNSFFVRVLANSKVINNNSVQFFILVCCINCQMVSCRYGTEKKQKKKVHEYNKQE